MKKKTEPKKLTLGRETVRVLDGDLQNVNGGIVSSDNRVCTYSLKCPPVDTTR
jgi:hypothetical protein